MKYCHNMYEDTYESYEDSAYYEDTYEDYGKSIKVYIYIYIYIYI